MPDESTLYFRSFLVHPQKGTQKTERYFIRRDSKNSRVSKRGSSREYKKPFSFISRLREGTRHDDVRSPSPPISVRIVPSEKKLPSTPDPERITKTPSSFLSPAPRRSRPHSSLHNLEQCRIDNGLYFR
jgi:hypothetical protein